jgi:hypothetical protein
MKKLIILLTMIFLPLTLFAQGDPNTATNKAVSTIAMLPQDIIGTQMSVAKNIMFFDKDSSKKDVHHLLEITGYLGSYSMFENLLDESLAPIKDCDDIQRRINNLLFGSYPKVIDTPMSAVETSVKMSEENVKKTIIGPINNVVFSKMKKTCSETDQQYFILLLQTTWKNSCVQCTQNSTTMIEDMLKRQKIF